MYVCISGCWWFLDVGDSGILICLYMGFVELGLSGFWLCLDSGDFWILGFLDLGFLDLVVGIRVCMGCLDYVGISGVGDV